MEIINAEKLAKELMIQYKITDFKFKFSDSFRVFGYCSETNKEISLSRYLTELNGESEVRDCILHEIAHALTPNCSHNEIWVRVAKAIGANGQRCYDDNLVEKPTCKWSARCENCDIKILRHRKNNRLFCSVCVQKNNGRFARKYKFKWIKN